MDFYLLFCGDGLLYGGGERETELAGLFKGEERQEFLNFQFEKKIVSFYRPFARPSASSEFIET